MKAISTLQTGVVRDVARALLEVAHEAATLEDLGEQIRRLLAGEVHAAQLRDGVIAVLEEHLLVELLGPIEPDRRVDSPVAADVQLVDELVEEQPPETLRRAGVAGKQRSLDDLGEVHEREDGLVQVREVPPQDVLFGGRERLGSRDQHRERL